MLPEFNEDGNLPPGIHRSTLDEVVARFGTGSADRQAGIAELCEFVPWAREAGIKRLLVDGSFVTCKESPNDVDVVILASDEQPEEGQAALDSAVRWPFLHIQVAADSADFEAWALTDFAKDKQDRPRGVVEIEL